jgi:DNA polymerase-3 subunit delta'
MAAVLTQPGVWADLVGQDRAVDTLRRAVEEGGRSMSHAWLFTGPPGSGRSNAARAFAAALQCPQHGCGHCNVCRTVLSGAHPDVTVSRTEQLSIGVDEVRELVRKAAMTPRSGHWQIMIVEDADRVTDRGADALLKSIEEPPARTIWLLCAPNPEDVIITIRSRTRSLELVTPSDAAVAQLLSTRDHVDPQLAAWAARAAQGHIGRAKRLATDEQARATRARILMIPDGLGTVSECLSAAAAVVADAQTEAEAATSALDAAELQSLNEALGSGTEGSKKVNMRHNQAALKSLADQQKARFKRIQRDALDRVLTELTTWYRDVLNLQLAEPGGEPSVVNIDQLDRLNRQAAANTPEQTLHRIDALLEARTALNRNVPALLATESLMLQLGRP